MKRKSLLTILCIYLSLSLTGCGLLPSELETPFQKADVRTPAFSIPVEPVVNSSYASQYAVIAAETDNSSAAGARLCIDNTMNTVISSENAFKQIYPASITKIMTALLVLEHGNLSDMTTVTEPIVLNDPMAVSFGLQVGDTMTVEALMYAMMNGSENDCAVALGRYIAGNDAAFVELMNQRAAELGATHTHFTNPHGLHSPEHYTTAYDLYLIFQELITHEEFQTIASTPRYSLQYTNGNGSSFTRSIANSNMFISQTYAVPEGLTILGGKTGTTNEAGCCLIVQARDSSGHDYIAVVCGASTSGGRYVQMQELLKGITGQ